MKVAIIGAGAAGLSAGYDLARRGVAVELFECDKALGGLAGSFLLDGGYVEKFYHFICLNDFTYQQTLRDLGLHHLLRWRLTDMGQYYNGRNYSLGRPYDDRTISNSLGLGKSAASLILSDEGAMIDPVSARKCYFRHKPEIFHPIIET